MSRIVKMTAYLASLGREIADGHFEFPTIQRVADLNEAELREVGFGYRAATIPQVARQVLAKGGVDWLDGLRAKTYDAARTELIQLGSVGPKLADCMSLFGLHFDEAVPIDTHVWKTCQDWYLPEFCSKGLTPQRYEAARRCFGERFGPLSGWAQQYVFYDRFLSYRRTKGGH
jgi:N-glycosylase/DNA lyase